MPCYDSRSEPAYVRKEAEKEWTHNSPIAALLCEACATIENTLGSLYLSKELQAWWDEHQKRDKLRSKATK